MMMLLMMLTMLLMMMMMMMMMMMIMTRSTMMMPSMIILMFNIIRLIAIISTFSSTTVGARTWEYDQSPTPKPREEGTPAQIAPDPCSNFLESTVPLYLYLHLYLYLYHYTICLVFLLGSCLFLCFFSGGLVLGLGGVAAATGSWPRRSTRCRCCSGPRPGPLRQG